MTHKTCMAALAPPVILDAGFPEMTAVEIVRKTWV